MSVWPILSLKYDVLSGHRRAIAGILFVVHAITLFAASFQRLETLILLSLIGLFVSAGFLLTQSNPRSKLYNGLWQIFLAFDFPFFASMEYLFHPNSALHAAMLVLASLMYGILAKPWAILPGGFLGAELAWMLHLVSPEPIAPFRVLGIFAYAFLAGMVGALMRFSMEISFIKTLEINLNRIKLQQRRKKDLVLRKFLSPSIRKNLREEKNPLTIPMARRECTIMYGRITHEPVSGEKPLQNLAQSMNHLYDLCHKQIRRRGGEMERLRGSEFMAVFPLTHSAAEAATSIIKKHSDQASPRLKVWFTLSKGELLVGNLGPADHPERTSLGKPLARALELGPFSQLFQAEIILDGPAASDLSSGQNLRWVGAIDVTGDEQQGQIRVFEYFGHNTDILKKIKQKSSEALHSSLRMFFQKNYSRAFHELKSVEEIQSTIDSKPPPPDLPVVHYLRLCIENMGNTGGINTGSNRTMSQNSFENK